MLPQKPSAHTAEPNFRDLFHTLTRRYGGADPRAITQVLSPVLIPIKSLDKTITRIPGQSHYRASFSTAITEPNEELVVRGRTGKFVPRAYVEGGGVWREIAKGRITDVDPLSRIAEGEVYVGGRKGDLEAAIVSLSADDYLEVDQYGAAAKVLSGLVEYALSQHATNMGYVVRRMPEDMARHLGQYYHYDFEFGREGVVKRIEVKSLWGTNTEYARLIHSTTKDYITSSCKFDTQDIFAVSLFLRTGNITDFAFARSVPADQKPYGLPRSSKHPDYVHQNPLCHIGDGVWFLSINDVWHLP